MSSPSLTISKVNLPSIGDPLDLDYEECVQAYTDLGDLSKPLPYFKGSPFSLDQFDYVNLSSYDSCTEDNLIHPVHYKDADIDDPEVLQFVISEYLEWVNTPYYCLIKISEGEPPLPHLIPKRGNRPYALRLSERINHLKEDLGSCEFFDPNPKFRGVRSTPLLLCTFEYDSNKISLRGAWDRLPHDYNLLISSLRSEYGVRVAGLRFNEPHVSGYPHLHVLIAFKQSFRVFPHRSATKKDQNGAPLLTFRVSNAQRETLRSHWDHGFIDVRGCYNTGAVSYVAKYLIKDLGDITDPQVYPSEKQIKALAIQWSRGMRAFSCSQQFIEILNPAFNRRDKVYHNSNELYPMFLGCYPSCYEKCLKDHGEIPSFCPYLDVEGDRG